MVRPGQVTKVSGELLEVVFCRPEDCARCGGCEGGKRETVLWVRGGASVGDTVYVEMPDRVVTAASLLAYALPLAGLLGGMVLGSILFPSHQTAAGAVGGFAGLGLTVALVALGEKRRRNDPKWQPSITKIIPAMTGQTEEKSDEEA